MTQEQAAEEILDRCGIYFDSTQRYSFNVYQHKELLDEIINTIKEID